MTSCKRCGPTFGSALALSAGQTFLVFALLIIACGGANAETTESSYIDRLKEQIQASDDETGFKSSEGYTERLRKQLRLDRDSSSEGYSKRLKSKLEKEKPEDSSERYSAKEKKSLPQDPSGSAIENVKQGKSELELKRPGEITKMFGLKVGAATTNSLKSGSAVKFADIYGDGWNPDIHFFYEWQLFHGFYSGNLGLRVDAGIGYFKGFGKFEFELTNQATGDTFGAESRTLFEFYTLPLTLAASYKINMTKYIRPYIVAGPSIVGYVESRTDSRDGGRGFSTGYLAEAGVAIPIGFLSDDTTWNLYAQHRIKRYYLTVEYHRLQTFTGPVQFNVNGVFAGLSYEF